MKDLKKLKQSLDIAFDYVNNQHEGECKKDAMNNLELAIKQVENLALCKVSQQRELLIGFCSKVEETLEMYGHLAPNEAYIDEYLKGN